MLIYPIRLYTMYKSYIKNMFVLHIQLSFIHVQFVCDVIIYHHGNQDMELNEIFTNLEMCERNVKICQKIYFNVLSKVVL